ncbi:TPR repeat protein [Lutibacter sp. Hel_I_33_5]|uniref:tetratricopeptide repeat protein n=1 Tax=Lutibacter sp. Hel_I_33_5 TaxID=1566289 RepID=UPI0011A587F7|nr:tetratricopeptide repeat protein [Lutibacter sp. Hel_I_33_5]TVZ56497.1 TPR repeat protein [Lutibacter sp. Hel_I_33_5]
MNHLQNILLVILMLFSSINIHAQQDTLKLQREARTLLRNGNKLYNQQKFTDASVAYKKALGKNSKYDKASYNLGNALYQEKNYKEAVPQFELTTKTAKTKVEKSEAYHNIGNAMMEQKQYQPAVDAYKNALRNNPNDDETRYNLAVAQKLLEKEKQKNKDKKDDKNKDKNKDKKDDKNKDKKDNKDGKDKDKKDDQNKDKGDNKQDKNKNPDKKKDQKEKPKPKQGQMTPQQIKQLLENLNNEEKKTQKKMNLKKAKGKKVKQEKDW